MRARRPRSEGFAKAKAFEDSRACIDRDHDLDPLRARPDFRKLIAEAKAAHKIDAKSPTKAEYYRK
jgi:hypothetical protein